MPSRLSVVVPIHNEADFLPRGLPGLIAAVRAAEADAEIILVENGSTDGTLDVARALADGAVTVLVCPEPDYGEAMREGFLAARGEWVVNVDVDYFSTDFLDRVLASDADLVIGSKRDPRSDDRRPWLRRLATRVFNTLLRVVLGSGVSDTHGMKGFRRELVADLVPQVRSRKDLFDTELVVRAERAGYRVIEVPVTVEELRPARSSLLRRVPRTVAGIIRMRRLFDAERRGARTPRARRR